MARVAELSAEITAETGDFERGLDRSQKALFATVKSSDQLKGALGAMGAATDEASQTQNQLAAAQHNATAAASKLAAAQLALKNNTHPEKQAELARDVAHAQVAMDRAGNEVTQLTGKMQGLGNASQKTGFSFTELNSAISIAKQAYGAIKGAIEAVINPTVDYAKQVRDLGRNIGATAEQTSMLIQAADDVMVSVGTLETGLQAAIRKGIEPTVEGIGKLADEYNAIQDPIARTKFLMDNFGRSGADLAPLMEQGSAGIDALGKSARNAGLVMDQEGVTSARNYEKATDNLGDAFKGLTYQIGGAALPALTQFVNAAAEAVGVSNLLAVAINKGAISQQDAADINAAMSKGFFTTATATEYLTDKLDKMDAEVANSKYLWESTFAPIQHVARAAQEGADVFAKVGKAAHGAVGGFKEVGKAAEDAAGGFDRFSDAMTDAALSGVMQAAQEDYLSVIKETTPEIDKLTAQIKKYQAAQGQSFTVTEDATTSAAEYELATIKAATAAQKLAEFTGDNREEYLGLVLASDRAAESVGKLGEGFGFTKEFTADYTKKIQEANGTLDELNAKQAAAEEALRKTTAEFVLQQAASSLTGQALLDFAHNTGLMDDASYNLAGRVQFLTGVWDLNKNEIIDVGREQDGLSRSLAELTTRTVAQTVKQSESLPVLEDTSNKMYDIRDAAHEAGGAVEKIPTKVETIDTGASVVQMESLRERAQAVRDTIAGIERNIDINTNFFTHGTPGGGGRGDFYGDPGPGGANGLNFVVPPGYPNDSFPVRVQSGEHVQVTPAGQAPKNSGGVTVIQNIYTTMPASSAVLLQTARAVMGGT